jgi:hypothetical protein
MNIERNRRLLAQIGIAHSLFTPSQPEPRLHRKPQPQPRQKKADAAPQPTRSSSRLTRSNNPSVSEPTGPPRILLSVPPVSVLILKPISNSLLLPSERDHDLDEDSALRQTSAAADSNDPHAEPCRVLPVIAAHATAQDHNGNMHAGASQHKSVPIGEDGQLVKGGIGGDTDIQASDADTDTQAYAERQAAASQVSQGPEHSRSPIDQTGWPDWLVTHYGRLRDASEVPAGDLVTWQAALMDWTDIERTLGYGK